MIHTNITHKGNVQSEFCTDPSFFYESIIYF